MDALTSAASGFRVLLVEDSPGDRWLLAEILRARGHTVTSCETGEAALAAWDEEPYPMVVLDWMLPTTSGLEVCRGIRERPGGKHCLILMITGKNEAADLEMVLDAGADDYVTKPVDVSLLNIRLAVAEKNVKDAWERMRMEEDLATANRELMTLFRNLGTLYFSVDLQNDRLIQVSTTVREFFGVEAEVLEAEPARWPELLPGVEIADLSARLEQLSGGRSLVLELQVPAGGGEGRWVEASLRPQRDPKGTVIRIDGVMADISDRKRNEAELAARNQELMTLHAISEITLSATSLLEGYQRIIEVAAESTGFPIASIERVNREGSPFEIVASLGLPGDLGKTGIEIPWDGSLSGLAARTGLPQIVDDITRKREYLHAFVRNAGIRTVLAFPIVLGEQAIGVLSFADTRVLPRDARLQRWGVSLANHLATFTDRLRSLEALRGEEVRYRTLAEELQRANRELESFGYTVSHDLRAPLRTMQGFAHTLLSEYGNQLDEKGRGYVQRILASGNQSELLIRDLLTYSKLSLEEIEWSPVSLDEVIQTALSQLQADLREAQARVEVQPRLPDVLGHRTTLVQVVSNLVSNALKFTERGERPVVRIRAEGRGDRVRLWIEDEGIGIPKDQRERIFRAFERGSEVQERPGTGIGLAIVRRGMERVGGRAGVDPGADRGSRFWIELRPV